MNFQPSHRLSCPFVPSSRFASYKSCSGGKTIWWCIAGNLNFWTRWLEAPYLWPVFAQIAPSPRWYDRATIHVLGSCWWYSTGFGQTIMAELYVDGSTNAHSAAWSVVVVRTDGTAHHLVGTLFGRVQLASQADDWIGARTVDNIAAEFSAFAIALDLACRMVPVRCIIRPDLQLSAILAAQQCVTDSNPQLAHLISVLATWLPSNASVQEVRGHSAHPWNDLADSVARWALLHDPCVDHSVSVLHQLVTAGADLQWSWVQGGPKKSLFHALPPVIDQQVCQFPLSLRRVPLETPCTSPLLEPSRCEVQSCVT